MRLPERAEAASDRSGAMLARAMAALPAPLRRRPVGHHRGAGAALPRGAAARGGARRPAAARTALEPPRAMPRTSECKTTEHFVAAERALHYSRLAGDSPSDTAGLDWALILGPRPADEALRALDEIVRRHASGSTDLGRAVMLAMLDHIDEAWQLAEARSDHMREVSGGSFAGDEYLATHRDRSKGTASARADTPPSWSTAAPPGSEGVMASWKSMLARDLCYLGRFDEAEPQLRAGSRQPDSGPATRTLVAAVEALLLTRTAPRVLARRRG